MVCSSLILFLFLDLPYVVSLREVSDNMEFGLISSNQVLQEQIKQIFEDDELLNELFPVLKKSCVKDALQIFLPQCLLEGVETISDSIKVETAVRLSLCQFEASGLAHIPEECSHTHNTENMMDCMLQLEASNQWWTTYNGYYQNLPVVCVTHGPMFQKEQIIKTFLNVTKFVNQLNENWETTFKSYMDDVSETVSQNLDNITFKFNDTLNHVDGMNTNINSLLQEMETNLLKNKDRVQMNIKKRDEEILGSIESLQTFINQLTDTVLNGDILQTVEEQKTRELSIWKEMEVSLKENRYIRLKEEEDIDTYISSLKSNIINLNKEMENLNQIEIKKLENHIQAELTNISNQVINEWLSLTKILNKDVQYWNDLITKNFNIISDKIETTIEKIDFMEHKINKLFKVFTKLSALLETCFKFACKIFKRCKEFSLLVILYPLFRIFKTRSPILKVNKFLLIIIGALLGTQLGYKLNIKKIIYIGLP